MERYEEVVMAILRKILDIAIIISLMVVLPIQIVKLAKVIKEAKREG